MARTSQIGVLRERMKGEHRVAITPDGVRTLSEKGHVVSVESSAGKGSGFSDEDYVAAGAVLQPTAGDVINNSKIVVKVKGLTADERSVLPLLRSKVLCCFPHFAGYTEHWMKLFLDHEITVFGYETIQNDDGRLPVLAPMSAIAGIAAVQYGAHYLQKQKGGLGITLGAVSLSAHAGHIIIGEPTVPTANVVVVGGGVAGFHAVETAAGMGARVLLFEKNPGVRERLREYFKKTNAVIIVGDPDKIFPEALKEADLLISAVSSPGARAPHILDSAMVHSMKRGAVIVDIAIDQGGSLWGARPTSHEQPVTQLGNGVLYCAIPNIPGQFPRQSTPALASALRPFLAILADEGVLKGVTNYSLLKSGLQTHGGWITNEAVARDLGMMSYFRKPEDAL
ncbi:MAG: alanine dehydrogenase [Parcubacteria group bacterium]|nr:alanine dehydrogenase [Parcubacteria group bacterium]